MASNGIVAFSNTVLINNNLWMIEYDQDSKCGFTMMLSKTRVNDNDDDGDIGNTLDHGGDDDGESKEIEQDGNNIQDSTGGLTMMVCKTRESIAAGDDDGEVDDDIGQNDMMMLMLMPSNVTFQDSEGGQ